MHKYVTLLENGVEIRVNGLTVEMYNAEAMQLAGELVEEMKTRFMPHGSYKLGECAVARVEYPQHEARTNTDLDTSVGRFGSEWDCGRADQDGLTACRESGEWEVESE